MTTYIALLRAVNVGGTGKLPMKELKAMCVDAGFADVETYIASGNVVFASNAGSATVKATLESRLRDYAGKPVGVLVRTARQLQAIVEANPLRDTEPRHTYVIFLDEPPPADTLARVSGRQHEQIHLGESEIYVHYGSGMGRSKLRIPAAGAGTARNLNTVTKLMEMASKTEP